MLERNFLRGGSRADFWTVSLSVVGSLLEQLLLLVDMSADLCSKEEEDAHMCTYVLFSVVCF